MEKSIHTNSTDRRSRLLPKVDPSQYPAIRTIKDFQQEIEQLIQDKKLSFMEAVLEYCSITGMEPETAGTLIKSSAKMKARIQIDAEQLHFLPRSSKLPI